jgi:SAM-dependent methyltransferase
MPGDDLTGEGLLQSREEWGHRNRVLSESMAALVKRFAERETERGIDVGCQTGDLTDVMPSMTQVPQWTGVDPTITEPTRSRHGAELLPGRADAIPFGDGSFDVALFANVYEHVQPEDRLASLREIRRVLVPGGVIVGQLPNPYFPIESHSRLPLMGWLPVRAQKVYWKLAPVSWEHDFFVVTIRHVLKTADAAGLERLHVANFNYPPEVIPARVRFAARMLERPMRRFPWAWQFVLRRPA